jgi:putative NADPH-quinone reductase
MASAARSAGCVSPCLTRSGKQGRVRRPCGGNTARGVKVLYLYCHPVPESFHAAIRAEAMAGLAEAGHEIDLCDLYAEGFDPVMSREERRRYHDTSMNQTGIETYVRRLRSAEAIVLQFPVWCFGPPAMLKGFLDRVLLPGVSFDISDASNVKPLLDRLRLVAGIVTYGRDRWSALAMGDPPRKLVMRYLPRAATVKARAQFHGLYNMNVVSEATRKAFIAQTRKAMARLG